jgi:hypothetical protein
MEARRLVSSLVLSRVSSFDGCMDLVSFESEYNKFFDDGHLLSGNDIAKFDSAASDPSIKFRTDLRRFDF